MSLQHQTYKQFLSKIKQISHLGKDPSKTHNYDLLHCPFSVPLEILNAKPSENCEMPKMPLPELIRNQINFPKQPAQKITGFRIEITGRKGQLLFNG